ncbi:hypothetical protein D3C72_1826100 [compost metagenome]
MGGIPHLGVGKRPSTEEAREGRREEEHDRDQADPLDAPGEFLDLHHLIDVEVSDAIEARLRHPAPPGPHPGPSRPCEQGLT